MIAAVAIMGQKFGRDKEEGREDPKMWGYTLEIVKRFREEIVPNHPGIRCRDITGIDWMNRQQVTNFYSPDEKFVECTRVVGDTARLIGELLERGT